jgi:trk system potassium uptake protein TrkH
VNLRLVARLLAAFTLFFTLTLLVPCGVSLGETTDRPTTAAFVAAMVIGLAVALLLRLFGSRRGSFFRKEGLAVVGIAWFLAGALAATPFVWSGAIPSFVDAFFECISGLTTTGATVLGTGNPTIESLPPSILLWRSLLQWMGGVGIVLVFIALLPSMGITGSRLLSSEQIGVSDESARPRMADQARKLFRLYIGLTIAAILAFGLAGMPWFDAICHSFTTLATGGFSTDDHSIGGYHSLAVELVAIVFMFLAGCNFLFLLRVMTRRQGGGGLFRSEFRSYLGITVVLALGATLSLWWHGAPLADEALGITHDYRDFGRCLRDGTFQVVSILTSTGFANADFERWCTPALGCLVFAMLIGGCTGSTAGGIKVLRVAICARLAGLSLRSFVRPRTVERLKIGNEVIPDQVVVAVIGLVLLWIVSIAAGAFVLVLDPRLDLVSAFTASASMMGCIGPAFGQVVPTEAGAFELVGEIGLGPYSGYGLLHPATKLVMALQMVLGRLEILAPLALLTPRFWRN